jgi:hypothetical protein
LVWVDKCKTILDLNPLFDLRDNKQNRFREESRYRIVSMPFAKLVSMLPGLYRSSTDTQQQKEDDISSSEAKASSRVY